MLVRDGLVDPNDDDDAGEDYRRWERSRSMELWQMDVVVRVRLRDGTAASVVTGIDDHSRFSVSALLVPKVTAPPQCASPSVSEGDTTELLYPTPSSRPIPR